MPVLRQPVESTLNTAVAVVNQTAALDGTAVGQGLLQRIQHEGGVGRAAHAPADNASPISCRQFRRPESIESERNIDQNICPDRTEP